MGPTPHTFFLFHVALSHLTHKSHTINFYTLSLLSPRTSLHHSLFLIHAHYTLSLFLIHITHPSHTPLLSQSHTLSQNPYHSRTTHTLISLHPRPNIHTSLKPNTHTHTHTHFSQYPHLHNS